MAIKMVQDDDTEETAVEGPTSLMGNQDEGRGDAIVSGRRKTHLVTFWCDGDQKASYRAYAAAHDMTVSALLRAAAADYIARGDERP